MEPQQKIGNMDAILFALTLEVVLMQMRILEGSTELRAQQWKITTENQQQQREKLVRDREMIKDVLRKTLIEVIEQGEFQTLQKSVKCLQHQANLATTKRREYEDLLRSKITIVDELNSRRRQWAVELRSADQKTALLRDKINDDQMNADARLAYAEKWILARAESLDMQYDLPRAPPPRLDHEQRVHRELLKAYAMQIQEREDSLKYWEVRYEADIKDMNARLTAKCDQLSVATARYTELKKLFDLHAGEIRSWLTFKRERAARLAREEHIRASATRIQSWWRGLMVRRALGQFKFLRNVKKAGNKNKKK